MKSKTCNANYLCKRNKISNIMFFVLYVKSNIAKNESIEHIAQALRLQENNLAILLDGN
jgi:hypothetical protein